MGAGPASIPLKKLTVARFLTVFAETENQLPNLAAQKMGSLIRAENGLGLAIRLIEQQKATLTLKNSNL